MINLKKGFTLIELLVVIGVLAVIAAGVVSLINPQDKLNAANDAKVQSDFGEIGTASQAYAATHGGFYEAALGDLVTSGDLASVPTAPTGYNAYTGAVVNTPNPCTAGTTCTAFSISAQLKSKKYVATPFWKFDSATGKVCAVANVATGVCP